MKCSSGGPGSFLTPKGVSAFLALAVSVLLAADAQARHFDLGSFVPAMLRCEAVDSNTITSDGVAACSPPVFLSNCDLDPDNALRCGKKSKADYKVRPSGRSLTDVNGGQLDMRAIFFTKDIEACDGTHFTGTITGITAFRMFLEDPACTGGTCAVPDLSVPFAVDCASGRCFVKEFANDVLETLGLAVLPQDMNWTAEVSSFDMLDPSGSRFLTPGLLLAKPGAGRRDGFPSRAKKWEARVVPPYETCLAADTDTFTSNGRPACSTPTKLSDCATDPAGAVAVDPTIGGYRKMKYQVRKGALRTSGRFVKLIECDGRPYTGQLTILTTFRATVADSGCDGGFCTTVEQTRSNVIDVSEGRSRFSQEVFQLGTGADWMSVEIISADILDRSGNPMLRGHGLLVRCNPEEDGLCFGN